MKLWEKVVRSSNGRSTLPFDIWAGMLGDPFVTQTLGGLSEEQVAKTVSGAYQTNGPVFSLVLARMMVFAEARFQWRRFNDGRPGDLFGTGELSVLERPWPGGTTGDLLSRMEQDASLAGNAYVHRVASDRLSLLRPEWVKILLGTEQVVDKLDEATDLHVLAYIHAPPGGEDKVLMPGEVAHYAPIPHPQYRFLGMSWITPVLRDVESDSAAVEHKRAFFKNGASPNMVIKFDATKTIDEVRRFKELMDEEHRGAANAYKTMFLGGGADVEVVGKDFKELEFAATQGKGESRLASAAGVPPSWVGFSEGLAGSSLNTGNFGAARRRFADGTMRPLWRHAAASLESLLRVPNGAHLWYDDRDIAFLREDQTDAAKVASTQAQTIVALVRDGFTPESVVDAVAASDWSLLVHSGRMSIQLKDPTDEGDDDA